MTFDKLDVTDIETRARFADAHGLGSPEAYVTLGGDEVLAMLGEIARLRARNAALEAVLGGAQ